MPELRTALPDGSVVHSDPEILSGAFVFVGTRVPVQTLIDYLEGGYSVDEFLDNFPSVRREQVNTFWNAMLNATLARNCCCVRFSAEHGAFR